MPEIDEERELMEEIARHPEWKGGVLIKVSALKSPIELSRAGVKFETNPGEVKTKKGKA